VNTCGCTEEVVPSPVGEYSQSCLGRERVFGHFCKTNNTPTLLLRLNYAVDLRYGVLHDIGMNVWQEKPVSRSVAHFNVLWQGDANNYALMALEHCGVPAVPLNITGPETIPVAQIAEHFGRVMGKKVVYEGEASDKAYLNNAAKAFSLFGYPEVSLSQMLDWQAEWIMQGGSSLGKPTHFEVNDGKF
jgi:nucleoside-diphosphate-sugar epimerase